MLLPVFYSVNITISMDGRSRALGNVFIERLWWPVKYEKTCPACYTDGHELHRGLETRFEYYHQECKHIALDKRSPTEVIVKGAVTTCVQMTS